MAGPLNATRRAFLTSGALLYAGQPLPPILVRVHVLFDRGAHLAEAEIQKFASYQERARRDYAVSGIAFDLQYVEGAYLRAQGYSEIPTHFLARRCINLFVTESLGYDIDRDRTGGCSMGPRPAQRTSGPDPFYRIFLGLREATPATLPHEYAHHFTLDTTHRPSMPANFWSDLRNDYYLWRQRHGVPIEAFRACANAEWVQSGQ